MAIRERYYDGKHCPNCGSEDIEGAFIEIVEGAPGVQQAEQHVECLECDATWYDYYLLAGYDQLEVQEEG